MKIRLSVFALSSLFSFWLSASYFGNCVAEDYPGLSIDEASAAEVTSDEELPESNEALNQLVSAH